MLAVSALPALLILGFRVGVPEAPLWLARHGRHDEAAAIVGRYLGDSVAPPAPVAAAPRRGMRVLFGRRYRRRTAVGALFYNLPGHPVLRPRKRSPRRSWSPWG